MRPPSRPPKRESGHAGRARKPLGLAVTAAALALLASGCAGRAGHRPATAAEAAAILSRWDGFRESVLARAPSELFYDATARRSVFAMSGVAAVRVVPGRSLAIVVEGPAGLPIARADWDGARTTVRREGKREQTLEGDAVLSDLGIPLPASSLSLLLFGLPDAASPDRVEIGAPGARLSWRAGSVACEIDPAGRPLRVLARDASRKVEIDFREWVDGVPSRIGISVSTGGTASLALRPDTGAT